MTAAIPQVPPRLFTQEEILRCQNVTSSWGGSRYNAFAFTEIGVAMLSGVLNSPVAVEANRRIMRAFVAYRHLAELPLAATTEVDACQ